MGPKRQEKQKTKKKRENKIEKKGKKRKKKKGEIASWWKTVGAVGSVEEPARVAAFFWTIRDYCNTAGTVSDWSL